MKGRAWDVKSVIIVIHSNARVLLPDFVPLATFATNFPTPFSVSTQPRRLGSQSQLNG